MSTILPTVLNEHQVHLFNFYHDAAVHEGMRYKHHLYGKVYSFESDHRLNAYSLAEELGKANCNVIITVSKVGYKVWVRLHANEYPHWNAMKLADLAMSANLLAC